MHHTSVNEESKDQLSPLHIVAQILQNRSNNMFFEIFKMLLR